LKRRAAFSQYGSRTYAVPAKIQPVKNELLKRC
jgi:hypothetical protein